MFEGWFFEDYIWYNLLDQETLDSYSEHTFKFKVFGYTNPFVFGNAGDIIMLTLLFLVLYPVYYGLFYFFMRRPRECTSIQFLDKKLKYNTLLFLLFFFFMELLLLSTVNVWRSNFTSLATATSTLFSYVLLVNHTIKVFRLLYWDSLLYSFTSSFFTETMCTTRTIRNSKSDTPFSLIWLNHAAARRR